MAAVEIGLLVLVALAVALLYFTMRSLKGLVVNAIVGLVVLFVVEYLGLVGIDIGLIVVAIVAIGGVPGAVVVALLAYLDIAFAGTVLPLLF